MLNVVPCARAIGELVFKHIVAGGKASRVDPVGVDQVDRLFQGQNSNVVVKVAFCEARMFTNFCDQKFLEFGFLFPFDETGGVVFGNSDFQFSEFKEKTKK
jgi:hypothetical protein